MYLSIKDIKISLYSYLLCYDCPIQEMVSIMFNKIKNKEQVLNALRNHKPVKNGVIRRQIIVRWLTVWTFASFLPIGLWVVITQPEAEWRVPGGIIMILAVIGLMALFSAWLARRKQGVNKDWGLAPLTGDSLEEFIELSYVDPEIEKIVSEWLTIWLDSNCHLRGTDLLFLQKMVKKFKQLNS
jgi:hypothetical protein